MPESRTTAHSGRTPRADRDGAWKEVLKRRFSQAIAFFYPEAYRDIDWERGVEFLDAELRAAARLAGKGRRVVDVLAKVWLKDGHEARVLLHVEVQSGKEAGFDQRMFTYNVLIFALQKAPVISLGILGYPQAGDVAGHFEYGRWGCHARLDYPVIRLFDFEQQWEELERSDDPFAKVVMAHIASYRTSRKPESRLRWKVRLMRELQRQGRLGEEEIVDVFRFLDLVMPLPDPLADEYDAEVLKLEEEQEMPRIGQHERRVEERGERRGEERGALRMAREAVLEALQVRFQKVVPPLGERVQQISDLAVLRELLRKAITAGSLDEFEGALP